MPAIDLGTCVRVSMAVDGPWAAMVIEGVVSEIVAPGGVALTARVLPVRSPPVPVVQYVVQCAECRLLRAETQMVVVCQ